MLTITDFDTIDEWTQTWFGDADKCINEYICCGRDTKALRLKIAKVYAFWKALSQVRSRMEVNDPNALEALYSRLQCLIDLSVE